MAEDTKLDLERLQKDYNILINLVNRLTTVERLSDSVNDMKNDVNETYRMIVKSLNPFYSISNQLEFDQNFKIAYSDFEKKYTSVGNVDETKLSEFHISCTKLEYNLNNLFNVTNDNEVGGIIGKRELWFQDDYLSHKRVYNFLSKLNNGLKNVNTYYDLQLFLSDKNDFEVLRRTVGLGP
jgi:hypothetical protein